MTDPNRVGLGQDPLAISVSGYEEQRHGDVTGAGFTTAAEALEGQGLKDESQKIQNYIDGLEADRVRDDENLQGLLDQFDIGEGSGQPWDFFLGEDLGSLESDDSGQAWAKKQPWHPDFGKDKPPPTAAGEQAVDVVSIMAMFKKGGKYGDVLTKMPGEFGGEVEVINPFLAQMLDMADSQNGRISLAQIANIEATSRGEVAEFNANAEVEAARLSGASAVQIANIRAAGDQKVVDARASSAEAIANIEALASVGAAEATAKGMTGAALQSAVGAKGAAKETAKGMEAAAKESALGGTGAAEAAAGGQLGAAQAAAGASGPFGFIQQGGFGETPRQDAVARQQLTDIFGLMNQPSLAAAEANRIGAQGNVFGLAAGQQAAGADPLTMQQIQRLQAGQTEAARLAAQNNPYSFAAGQAARDPNFAGFTPTEIANIAGQTPAAFAARGQVGAAQAQATPFGALSVGDQFARGNANAILRAQAATNPFASLELSQQPERRSAIDQILRGGLTAQERIAEINAEQSGQNLANQLNFIGNPSAVGFATERGLFGGGNNQILQDINNSPEGNMPGSLFGFNSPTAAGAGGGQTTTVNTGNFNPNLSTTRNWSPEQMGFYQGVQSAGGQTPEEVQDSMESLTPQGV